MISPTSSNSSVNSSFERVDSPFSSDGSDVLGEQLIEQEFDATVSSEGSGSSESSESSLVVVEEPEPEPEPLDETVSLESSESSENSESSNVQEVVSTLDALELAEPVTEPIDPADKEHDRYYDLLSTTEPDELTTSDYEFIAKKSEQLREDLESLKLDNERGADAVDKIRIENALRKVQLANWKEDGVMKENYKKLKTDFSGAWKIVESHKVSEYLRHRQSSETNDLLFQLADVHFHFSECGTFVTTYESVNEKKYHERCLQLSEPIATNSDGRITFISGDRLKTIYLNGNEKDIEERYVKDGRLFVQWSRFGVQCTRIYEREGRLAEQVKELQEQLEKEKDAKNDLVLTMQVRAEALKTIPMLAKKLTEANLKIQKLEEKIQGTSSKPIKEAIVGKWRKTGDGVSYVINFKVEGDMVLVKPPYESKYCAKKINCLVSRGKFSQRVFVENNQLVMCDYHSGEELSRCERSVRDGKLVTVVYTKGVVKHEGVYERIGEPF